MRWIPSRALAAFPLLIAMSLGTVAVASAAEANEAVRYATSVRVAEHENTTRVVVEFTESPSFTARLEREGLRLLIDIPDAGIRGAPPALTDPVGVVGGVLTQAFSTDQGQTTRILVTLREQAKYAVAVDGNQLVVRLVPGKSGVLDDARVASKSVKPSSSQAARLTDVGYDRQQDHERVVLELSATPVHHVARLGSERTRLTLEGAQLPARLQRALDVSAFAGNLRRISSYSDPDHPGSVIVDVDHEPGVEAMVERRGPRLMWLFYPAHGLPSSVSGVASDGGVARRARTVSVDPTPAEVPEIHTLVDPAMGTVATGSSADSGQLREQRSEPGEAGAFTPGMLAQQGGYARGRVDLDLKDSDIRNVLRLLADIGGVNIVAADNVDGSVTFRMRNVPWDEAMEVILQSKKLGYVRQGNMIRVAPLDDLEKEREMALARRQQEAKLAPLETRLIPVSYAEAGVLQRKAAELISSRGSISVDERTNVLIARDLAGNLDQVEELVRALDTQTPQVLVEARIVEATSRYLRDVGIQWGGDATFSAATGNPTGVAFPNSVGVAGGASDPDAPTAGLSPFNPVVSNPNFAVNLPAAVGTGQGGALGLTFGSLDNTINLGVRLSAAESSGMLRILSSPRILTLDNKTARISQGTLIPFSQISAQGVQTTFQQAKLQLLVRPHVTADGSVSMSVKINRDEPDFNQTSARGDPTILKREAETELLVMDGHTAVIGGIYTRNTGRNLDQVPFFGDIPLLGLLFQRRRSSDSRFELVIFLTPRIVNRADALGR